jgi:AraC-like DNA-binding protein
MYDSWVLGEPEAFHAEAIGRRVGDLVFNDFTCSPMRFRRGSKHLQRAGSDFLVLQEQMEGEELLVMDHGLVRLLPGNLYLRDWSYRFDSQATAMRLRSVVIPRHRLRAGAGPSEDNPVFSWSIGTPDGEMIHRLWSDLLSHLPGVDRAVAENLCAGFLGFTEGLLGRDVAPSQPTTLRAMEEFLRVRLRGDIGVEDLCRRFHASRSKVYRLFEPHGGVGKFLQQQRLRRCFEDLRLADPRRARVADIAATWGYGDASGFSRRFRAEFGVPPSKVLGSAAPAGAAAGSGPFSPDVEPYNEYFAWLSRAPTETPEPPRSVLDRPSVT